MTGAWGHWSRSGREGQGYPGRTRVSGSTTKRVLMLQVRVHGRGGQGVVTAAELLARAAFLAGHEAQAIPSFGSERTGAPVVSYCRIADRPIRTREPVLLPDVVLVQDSTLLHGANPFAGLAPGGTAIINTRHTPAEVGAIAPDAPDGGARVITVPAHEIVMEHLGAPKPAAAMLGAFAAATGAIALDAVESVFRTRFPGAVGEQNAAAARAGFAWVLHGPAPEPEPEPEPEPAREREPEVSRA